MLIWYWCCSSPKTCKKNQIIPQVRAQTARSNPLYSLACECARPPKSEEMRTCHRIIATCFLWGVFCNWMPVSDISQMYYICRSHSQICCLKIDSQSAVWGVSSTSFGILLITCILFNQTNAEIWFSCVHVYALTLGAGGCSYPADLGF